MEKIQKLYPDGVEYGTVILVEPPAPEELGDIIEEVENGGTVMRFKHPGGDFGYYHYEKKAPPETEAQIKEIWKIYAQDFAKIVQDYSNKQTRETERRTNYA